MKVLRVKRLPSNGVLISLSANIWAQVPPGFCDEEIPDEYIFHASYARDAINEAFRDWRANISADEYRTIFGVRKETP